MKTLCLVLITLTTTAFAAEGNRREVYENLSSKKVSEIVLENSRNEESLSVEDDGTKDVYSGPRFARIFIREFHPCR